MDTIDFCNKCKFFALEKKLTIIGLLWWNNPSAHARKQRISFLS